MPCSPLTHSHEDNPSETSGTVDSKITVSHGSPPAPANKSRSSTMGVTTREVLEGGGGGANEEGDGRGGEEKGQLANQKIRTMSEDGHLRQNRARCARRGQRLTSQDRPCREALLVHAHVSSHELPSIFLLIGESIFDAPPSFPCQKKKRESERVRRREF